jgi:hypothetical protein
MKHLLTTTLSLENKQSKQIKIIGHSVIGHFLCVYLRRVAVKQS